MANRRDYYFKQAVTEEELNDGFAQLENADHALSLDMDLVGIFSGGAVVQHAPTPNLTVDVATPVVGYDNFGERVFVSGTPNPLNVNVAQDSSSVSTTVAGAGNEKYVSIALKFTRALSDPRTDGNSNTVYFVEDESYEVVVTQGAEAALGTAPLPAIDPDALLLCDVHRTHGQTQVFNADISAARRDDAFIFTGSPFSVRAGTLGACVQSMLNDLNNHVNSIGTAHPASAIGVSALPAWADATANPGTDLQSMLSSIITELATDGTHKVWGAGFTVGSVVQAGAPLLTQLQNLSTASFIYSLTTSAHWANGTTVPSDNLRNYLGSIITALGNPAIGGGTDLIGARAISGSNLAIPSPSGGDLSVAGQIQYLCDHAAPSASPTFTGTVTLPAGGADLTGSPTVTRVQEAPWVNAAGTSVQGGQVTANPGDTWGQEGRFPHGSDVVSITVHIGAQAGDNAPATPAILELYKQNVTTGAVTVITAVSDTPSASAHDLTLTITGGAGPGGSEVVDRTTYYYGIAFFAESGGTAAARVLQPCRVSLKIPSLDIAA